MTAFTRYPCDQQPATEAKSPSRCSSTAGWVLLVAILGSAMPGIDNSAVNVALPVLQRDLRSTSSNIQWVVEGYSLFLSALILVGGSLGDRFGRRRMFVLGVIVFGVASAACAASQTIGELIVSRCVQGIGGALLIPESLALITAAYDEQRRGQAIGTWSGFSAIAVAIGPLLGGWFVQSFTWRLVFLINLPIAVVIFFVTKYRVEESRDYDDNAPVDWRGAVIATASLGLLVFGFIGLQGARFDPVGFGAVIAGALLAVAFVYVERRESAPMVPLSIFSSRDFTVSNLYTLLLYAALGASFFFIPFNLINVQGYSPAAAGAALVPMILIMFLSSRWSGGLVARIGARTPLLVGALIAGVGYAIFAFIGVGGSYLTTVFPAVMVLGIGTSTFVAPLTTTVMNSIGPSHAGSASGVNNAVSRVAGLLAIAIFGIVLVNATHGALRAGNTTAPLSPRVQSILATDSLLSGRVPDQIPAGQRSAAKSAVDRAYAVGFRDVMLLCAGLSVASAILALLLPSRASQTERVMASDPQT